MRIRQPNYVYKKIKKKYGAEQSTYANSPPKAPAQKAQQGVSVRKCNRSPQ